MDLHKFLWAKTSRENPDSWHPLLFHLLDSGNVTLALWRHYLPSSTRSRFTRLLSLDEDSAGRLLAYWTALRDIGKASPAFQGKSAAQKELLLQKSIPFPLNLPDAPHGLITAWALLPLLPPSLRLVGRILAGHHGNLPN